MMEQLQLSEGSRNGPKVHVQGARLPLGSFIKVKPLNKAFYDITNPRAVFAFSFYSFILYIYVAFITLILIFYTFIFTLLYLYFSQSLAHTLLIHCTHTREHHQNVLSREAILSYNCRNKAFFRYLCGRNWFKCGICRDG